MRDEKLAQRQALIRQLRLYLENGECEPLYTYLKTYSHLPGPRGNLELAGVFADVVEEFSAGHGVRIWELCLGMTQWSAEQAPVNSPQEFVPFCGTLGIGVIGARMMGFFDKAIQELRRLSKDPRWRMREAVAMGLQTMLDAKSQETLERLKDWIPTGNPLELRAVAAAVAEPSILKDKAIALVALGWHELIIEQLRRMQGRRTEDFRVLRQALGYTLSVVVARVPEEGFDLIDRWLATDESDLRWIVKSNLKKNRLSSRYPEKVQRRLGQI